MVDRRRTVRIDPTRPPADPVAYLERHRLWRRWEQTGDSRFKVAARVLLPDADPPVESIADALYWRERKKPASRPRQADIDRLIRMAGLIADGGSINESARQAAAEDPGHSVEATRERLRRKWRQEGEPLLRNILYGRWAREELGVEAGEPLNIDGEEWDRLETPAARARFDRWVEAWAKAPTK